MLKKASHLLNYSNSKVINLLIIAVVIFILYSPSLQNDFVNWDDDVFLLNNDPIKGLDWTHVKAIFERSSNTTYVPLTSLTFAIEYHFFGLNPFVFHLNNILLHIGVTLFIYLICIQCNLSSRGAFLAALIFGIHPMKVESVAWVTERKDMLYGILYTAAIWHYIRYIKTKNNIHCLWTIFLGLLSALAKPVALHLPFILILYDWFFRRKLSWYSILEKIWVLVPISLVSQVTFFLHPRAGTVSLTNLLQFPVARLLRWIWGYIFYIRQFLWPYSLTLFYKIPQPITFFNMHYLIPLSALILIVIGLIKFKNLRLLLFAFYFYTITIFILIFFSRDFDAQFVAIRHMYIPSIGFCILTGYLIDSFLDKTKNIKKTKRISRTIIFSLFIICSVKTFHECKVWKNGVTLWKHQIKNNPDTVPALLYNKLGEAYALDDNFNNILFKYGQFIKTKQLTAAKRANIHTQAITKKDIRMIKYVISLHQKALKINPTYTNAYYKLGNIYKYMQDYEKAIFYYSRPLVYSSDDPESYYHLGILYRDINQPLLCVDAFNKAIFYSSDDQRPFINIIKAYNEIKNTPLDSEIYTGSKEEVMEKYSQRWGEIPNNVNFK